MLAQNTQFTNPVTPGLSGFTPEGFIGGLIRTAITAAFIFAAIFFIFNLIMGGIDWMNSAGDKQALENARKRVLNAVVGIVVVLSTYIIVNFIAKIFNINLLQFDLSALIIA